MHRKHKEYPTRARKAQPTTEEGHGILPSGVARGAVSLWAYKPAHHHRAPPDALTPGTPRKSRMAPENRKTGTSTATLRVRDRPIKEAGHPSWSRYRNT